VKQVLLIREKNAAGVSGFKEKQLLRIAFENCIDKFTLPG
jgi:hypothetical protein